MRANKEIGEMGSFHESLDFGQETIMKSDEQSERSNRMRAIARREAAVVEGGLQLQRECFDPQSGVPFVLGGGFVA